MDWTNVTWFLTALAAVVVLLTRIRLGGEDHRSSGVSSVSTAAVRLHTVIGVLVLVAWIAALVTNNRPLLLGTLAGWWLLAVTGLVLLARWLPSGGRHAGDKATDEWGGGAGLSVLGHVGMMVGVCFFTFVALTNRI